MRSGVLFLALLAVVAGCRNGQPYLPHDAFKTNVRIYVSARDVITIDGQPATPEQVHLRLSALQKTGGALVWLWRANPSSPNAVRVTQLIGNSSVPVHLVDHPQ